MPTYSDLYLPISHGLSCMYFVMKGIIEISQSGENVSKGEVQNFQNPELKILKS